MSEALAKELHTVFVPEFARIYLHELGRPYMEQDLFTIARGQVDNEDILAEEANKFLICDTDLYVIKVWAEHKYGNCDKWIIDEISSRKYDLYLLTYIDTEWTDDPQREHPEPEMRTYFYKIYLDIMQNTGVPWVDIRGSHEDRVSAALQAIRALV